ncbi:hypothetical protein RT717_05520 [Imperialibacter roseus]|uniref:Uncharacterized protein n=1 Tax=Imperialibacter roseus TaxID=1324217 RepID=A0ABZ0IWP1_9BACT|nr:hypothetical protein [Imperialibacter roseus]WOK08091.1 hypothetical protein RT717_05520 [Imperialibacter roseus]
MESLGWIAPGFFVLATMFAKLLARLSGHGTDTEAVPRSLIRYLAEVIHEEKHLSDGLSEIGSYS